MNTEKAVREKAIHLLRSGSKVQEVADECGRSKKWVYKWQARYEAEGYAGLAGHSQAPKKHGRKLSQAMRRAILRARSELEAEAASGECLKYIGPQAVRTRLKRKRIKRVPSCASIGRVLKEAGMTRTQEPEKKVSYPHLHPDKPLQLIQVDIVPHFLTGGTRIPCFNAIDSVSRYPTGEAYAQRRSVDAAKFLVHLWQEIGIPTYTQVDNEGCFSGGATHPHVLGYVVRHALMVGTELLFSPVYHPQSNGYIERFHQDYNRHVWEDTYLRDLNQVRQKSRHFFALYRQSEHHSSLNEQAPAAVHFQQQGRKLSPHFKLVQGKPPLYAGRIHFIRRVSANKTVSVLNVSWAVKSVQPDQGVWVTLELTTKRATLSIYDKAPDAPKRKCFNSHPFPLAEPVRPFPKSPLHHVPLSDS